MQRHVIMLRPLGSQASPILSHTLFGATCWALAALGEDVGAILSNFENGPRFAVSGAYPYIRDRKGNLLLLLPRPPLRIPAKAVEAYDKGDITTKVDKAKKIQKVTYLSPGVADRLRFGQWTPADVFREVMRGTVEIHHATLFLSAEVRQIWGKSEPTRLWKKAIVQRNSVDRLAGATVEGLLFQQEETSYDAGRAGLWFAVWADDGLWHQLQAAFRFVADTGLGGKRSVGKGHFDFDAPQPWETFFPPLQEAKRFLSLSHYIPAASGETTPLAYTLDVIRQKVENRYPDGPQRVYIATLRAFQPGGLFAAAETHVPIYGRLLPLGNVGNRTVYYNGLTIPLWGQWEM